MSLTTEHVLKDVLALSDDQRAELAVRLLQSLDREVDPDAEDAWAAEIERRCAALDAGETTLSDWQDVRRRIEKELQRSNDIHVVAIAHTSRKPGYWRHRQ